MYSKLFLFGLILSFCTCKTKTVLIEDTAAKEKEVEQKIEEITEMAMAAPTESSSAPEEVFSPSQNMLGVSLEVQGKGYAPDMRTVNKLSEELVFKDIAPSYYMHLEGIYGIPKEVKQITTTGEYDYYDYFFDDTGRVDSLFSDRYGSFKIVYRADGLIDHVKNLKDPNRTDRVKYFSYFMVGDNKVAKYETEEKNKPLVQAEFDQVFTFNTQGQITKTNYGRSLENNYIEYYTIDGGDGPVKLIKSQAHTYFFISGYQVGENGIIQKAFFTNDNLDLESSEFDVSTIKAGIPAPFKATYDEKGRLKSLGNGTINHIYNY